MRLFSLPQLSNVYRSNTGVSTAALSVSSLVGLQARSLSHCFPPIPKTAPDALFGISSRATEDSNPDKIPAVLGAYRDHVGKPWVLPTVREAERAYDDHLDQLIENKEYDALAGFKPFREAALNLILGSENMRSLDTIASSVSIGGTGAIRLALEFMRLVAPKDLNVLISAPTWPNHMNMIKALGFPASNIHTYPQLVPGGMSLNLDALLRGIDELPPRSLVILQACAHNPSATDPTPKQWGIIADKLHKTDHYVLVDSAYQGFTTGDFDSDALGVRTLAARDIPLLICQSFSKNMGMYGDRLGCLSILCDDAGEATNAQHLIERVIVRTLYSNPPRRTSRVAYAVMTKHKEAWKKEVDQMAKRIIQVRSDLVEELTHLKTPGDWSHLLTQRGMFALTGINAKRSAALAARHHVYLPLTGRVSLVGLHKGNTKRFAKAFDEVVRDPSLD